MTVQHSPPQTLPIGQWIKKRRKSLGMTQAQLARGVSCAVTTIQKIELGQRRPSVQLAKLLAVQLELPCAEREHFVAVACELPPAEPSAPLAEPPSLMTTLIGRDDDVQRVVARLATPGMRLVTLVGPPGVGKTSLALQVAAHARGEFPDGVVWIPLAALQDSALVLPALAHALAVPDQLPRSLLDVLRDRRALLIFDNFEHVTAAAPQITRLLSHAPQITCLVTSRARLKVLGKQVIVVPPLPVPPPATDTADRVLASASAALFVACVQSIAPGWQLSDQNAPAVAALCRRLDGLPLALELAATRCAVLAPSEMLVQIDHWNMLLTNGLADVSPRQQSLWATLDWSFHLLPAGPQKLLMQLAVFVDGARLDAIAWVACTAEADTAAPVGPGSLLTLELVPQLDELLRHSLLQTNVVPGGMHYRLLETIRDYARAQAEAAQLFDPTRSRMAHYFIHYAQQIETCSDEAQRVHLMATLDEDYANIRVALEWSIANDPLVALRLVVALDRFWYRRGYLSECRRWLTQVLALPLPGSALPFQAKACRMCGEMANNLGDYAEAECCLHKALSAFQQLNDDCSICATFNSLGNLAADQRRSEQAIAYYEQGLAIARRLQHDHWIVNLLSNLGLLYDDMGEYDRAEDLLRQNVMLSEQLDNQFGRAVSWLNLGMTLHHRGQYQAAVTYLEGSVKLCRELQELPALATALCGLAAVCLALGDTGAAQAPLRESLDLWRRARDQLGICYALEIFAQLAIMCGEPQRAIVWLDMASQIRSTIGAPRSAFDQALFERLSQQIQPLRALDPPPSRSSPAWSVEWILDDVQEWDDFVSALRFGAEGVSE